MKKDQVLIVITKTYDLILWSCKHTSRFPRNHRFEHTRTSIAAACHHAGTSEATGVERLRPRANGQRLGGGERGETEGFVRRNCLVR